MRWAGLGLLLQSLLQALLQPFEALAVSRLEHALEDFEGEWEGYRQRLADARRRLPSYETRGQGCDFAFAGELAEKRRQLAEVEAALAKNIEITGEIEPPRDRPILVRRDRLLCVGGH